MADALPALAEVEDLEKRLKRAFTTTEDQDWAQSVLDEASEVVRAESGSNTWVNPDDPTEVVAPRIVWIITLRVAERAIRNPDGYSAETAGDYSYQRNAVGADGGLYLTEWELRMLRRVSGRSGVWTQQVTRGEDCLDIEWVNDQYGYEPIPIGTWPRW